MIRQHIWRSIDVGIGHLAILVCRVQSVGGFYSFLRVSESKLMDIRKFECDREICPLGHEKSVADYMHHAFLHPIFARPGVDLTLIERQPPLGIQTVQEILRFKLHNGPVEMVSPRSVHCLFDMSHDYEERKRQSLEIASRYHSFQDEEEEDKENPKRLHDLSDALLLVLWKCHKLNEALKIR